ncbi:cytochrome P450 [Xanthomonas theicola]|uniref:Cytochrome P450 n=1 Tax=Xanthomonas theicola TaxID=56464 RepID=A0A2S6ZC28_9XANT|nr:cytochrome P450 [Xanthomonas theicola]PPT86754.1 cytochrome P450 [Xanthomonas theicola]QNH26933.1 cytochrome P450 [Xanthomonas theicola]
MRASSIRRVPPGPRGHWALGNRAAFSDDPLAFLQACARDHGDVVRIAERTYLVAEPALIGEVLGDDGERHGKCDPDPSQRRAAFPASVMNSVGKDWRQKRQRLQPAFRSALVRDYAAQAVAATQPLLQRWAQPGDAMDMRVLMTEVCAQLGAGFLLGDPSQSPHLSQMLPMVDAIMQQTRSQSRHPWWWPTPGNRRLRRARDELDAALDRILAHCLDTPPSAASVLDLLLAEDPQGRSRWCRDETAAMLMSALEPMAAGLAWTLLLLAQHPQTAQALADEAGAALDADALPGADVIERLPLAKACVKEAMRLYPPAWMTARIAQRATTLSGFDVPAGTQLVVSQWVVHRDRRNFSDPDAFVPERWLHGARIQPLPRYAYFPFGGGPRSCIGSMLAMTQMTVVIACVLHAFALRLAPDARPSPFPALVLRPLDVRIALLPRPAGAAGMSQAWPRPSPSVSDIPHG